MSLEANMKAETDNGNKKRNFRQKILFFLVILLFNILALYAFESLSTVQKYHQMLREVSIQENRLRSTVISSEKALTIQLNTTQDKLRDIQSELQNVQNELRRTMVEYQKFVGGLRQTTDLILSGHTAEEPKKVATEIGEPFPASFENDPYHRWMIQKRDSLPKELKVFVAPRKLPLGWNPSLSSDTMVSGVGHACIANKEDIDNFMNYEVGKACPDDDNLAQKLLLAGCEPLPRRRCFARGPLNFTEPVVFPESMWTIPKDGSIRWSAYDCKSFACLNGRAAKKVFADCLDCFDLNGREKHRWVGAPGALDFTIEQVLALKKGLRVGLDIGGGTGSFAVRMREHNVTIVTSTLNLGGPFNNFIAHRGVVPIYMSISQRLPFWDNTLDLVHSMHVLSNWIPTESLEFIFFDIDRILRPGGILWLDHFFCIKTELDNTYIPMINRLGYNRLKWNVGKKLDRGEQLQEVYLSALLEKPLKARL